MLHYITVDSSYSGLGGSKNTSSNRKAVSMNSLPKPRQRALNEERVQRREGFTRQSESKT